jgi:hypothetical protein
MARKQKYSNPLKCPRPDCGNAGIAYYEENETPPHHQGRDDRKLLSIDGAFTQGGGYDPDIYCKRCGTKVIS